MLFFVLNVYIIMKQRNTIIQLTCVILNWFSHKHTCLDASVAITNIKGKREE